MPFANAGIYTGTTRPNMGQRWRGAPAQGPAAGNSAVTRDARGAPSAYPGREGGAQARTLTPGGQHGANIGPRDITTPDLRNPALEARAAYGGGWADGKLTLRERFVQAMRGTTRTGAQESHSGIPNPEADGPPRPEYLQDNRTESWQIGTDKTTQEDNDGPFAATTTQDMLSGPVQGPPQWTGTGTGRITGRRFALGNQGDPWTTIMGPPLSEYRDYGIRGAAGMHGPQPPVYALPGDGSGFPAGTLIAQGDDAGWPVQKVRGGPPHGLHSPTVPPVKVTLARQANITQSQLTHSGRVDRPNNSKIAGQSFGQTAAHEGNPASTRLPRTQPVPKPGVTSKFLPGRT
jgi:hypothetical protein